jgi:hypothetical protein
MLSLPNVTLLSIDCMDPLRTIKAMRYSLLQAKFADAVLVTDRKKFSLDMVRTIGGRGRIDQITVHFVEPGPRSDYERQIVAELPRWFHTHFCLFQEWDSAIVNAAAWNPVWLHYDFIGAPWPYDFNEIGYPACTLENCIGNGGFSLRSRRFCVQTGNLFGDMGRPNVALRLSDAFISRTLRPHLENAGLKFASEDEALRFACENRFYNGQFGIHGKNTIAMNGWKWDFEWLR